MQTLGRLAQKGMRVKKKKKKSAKSEDGRKQYDPTSFCIPECDETRCVMECRVGTK